MKVGDLVKFNPSSPPPGALTAVKLYARLLKETAGLSGIILHDRGSNVEVAFGNKVVILNKNHLEVINESR